MKRCGLNKSIYDSKIFKEREEQFVSTNTRDRLVLKARNSGWSLSQFDSSEIESLDLLNHLHNSVDGLVRDKDGEIYLLKGFSIDLTNCKRLAILKVLYYDITISVHEDLFLKELSNEEKSKSDNSYEYEIIYKI